MNEAKQRLTLISSTVCVLIIHHHHCVLFVLVNIRRGLFFFYSPCVPTNQVGLFFANFVFLFDVKLKTGKKIELPNSSITFDWASPYPPPQKGFTFIMPMNHSVDSVSSLV